MKYKIIKLKNPSKFCVMCHTKLRKVNCEIWWGGKGDETFHHIIHISCLYRLIQEVKHPTKEDLKVKGELEKKYPKELVIDALK